jgi:crossover junction endodeoxyribonuclease RuvC
VNTLGLDISTKTGAVVLAAAGSPGLVLEEEICFPKLKELERASAIAGRIIEIIHLCKPGLIVLEGYGFANAHSLATLVEIGTVVRYFLRQLGHLPLIVPPNTLKKFVTGVGNSPKDKIMMEVLKRWGHESKTNNTADAYGLAALGLGTLGKLPSLTKPQKEVIAMLAKSAA